MTLTLSVGRLVVVLLAGGAGLAVLCWRVYVAGREAGAVEWFARGEASQRAISATVAQMAEAARLNTIRANRSLGAKRGAATRAANKAKGEA